MLLDHQRLERTLDDCARCIESKKLAKHCIVAIGIHEIIAGMLDLPPSKWRKKTVQGFDQLKQKCQSMKTEWEPYDWTKKIKHR
uniref:Saposin B-type domain-containing protein n=1 Tax=Heterorhabditis bacteriophora TaxID=37862 RepID=A0A1I7XA68_HETBA